MRRIFDICHGCRRCFNLCDAFPRLFDLIDNSETGELDGVRARLPAGRRCLHAVRHVLHDEVPLRAAARVQLDFPHVMLRYRAVEHQEGRSAWRAASSARPTATAKLAPLCRAAGELGERPPQRADPAAAGEGRRYRPQPALPKYHGRTFCARPPCRAAGRQDRAGRRAQGVLYATCFVNYNNPSIGEATQAVLARNGVETEVVYPGCCRMPQLEAGDLGKVAGAARQSRRRSCRISTGLRHCRAGAVLRPDAEIRVAADRAGRPGRREIGEATFDVAEYIVGHRRKEGWRPVCSRSTAASPCTSPVTPGPEHGPEIGRDAAPAARGRDQRDRALLRAWRLLGRHEGEFRDRA
jgi:glycerol-3-phosphate dehydrogenase subunit C